jgi:hypothetical protein
MTAGPPEKPDDRPRVFSFEQLRFKRIEVMANNVLYRGVLIGADENDIYLKGDLRWLILPLDRINSIRLEGARQTFAPEKIVDAGFYEESDGE